MIVKRQLCALLIAAAGVGAPLGASAQQDLALSMPGDAAEREALTSLDEQKWARARQQAEAILKGGDSALAYYVLAMVHFEAEGNLARALFLLRKAQKILVDAHGAPPTDYAMRGLHQRFMRDEIWILGSMDDREGQLKAIARFEDLYQSLEVYKMWPLVKLGRFDEARAIGERLIYSEDENIRERAYNGMMAVEDEARRRRASYEWGKRGNEITRGQSCIISSNLALAARRCFKLDESIRYDRQAVKATDGSCPTSPYGQLSLMYLLVGDLQKSLSALKSLREVPREPRLRVQNEMFIRSRAVELLMALNQPEVALERAEEIIRDPDRGGNDSASEEIRQLEGLVLYWAVTELELRRLAARASARPLWAAITLNAKAMALSMGRWRHQRVAITLATHGTVMRDMARPYYNDALPWYSGVIATLLGDGIWQKAIDEARAEEVDFPVPAGAFLDGFRGEIAWRAGDWDEAARLGAQALEHLPKRAALFQRRIKAWLADVHLRQGRVDEARADLHTLLRLWPTALALLDVRLPVTIRHDGSALAQEIAGLLGDSPWLREPVAGLDFEVAVESASPEAAQICLRGQGGFQYACVATSAAVLRQEEMAHRRNGQKDDGPTPGPPPSHTPKALEEDPLAVVAVDRFHEKAFAPKLELTQSDLNSLDGRATRASADSVLQEIIGPSDLVNHR